MRKNAFAALADEPKKKEKPVEVRTSREGLFPERCPRFQARI